MLAWSSLLPDGLLQSYGVKPFDLALRTEMDSGLVRMRRRFGNGPSNTTISWLMDREQFAYFQGWFLNVALAGTQPFTMPINVGAGGCIDHECKFLDAYSYSLERGDLYRVEATLQIKQLSVFDADTIAVIDEYGDVSDYGDFLDIFEIFVNQDLPNSSSMGA